MRSQITEKHANDRNRVIEGWFDVQFGLNLSFNLFVQYCFFCSRLSLGVHDTCCIVSPGQAFHLGMEVFPYPHKELNLSVA